MAERNLLFTWDLQSFDENKNAAHDLLSIRIEFERKNLPLSQSLLMWEKDSEKWSLVDFKNKKVYHFEVNENEVEVLEEIGGWRVMGTNPANLLSFPAVYGTHEGFADWLLMLVELVASDQSGLDYLKRTDLSARKLSFEIVHPELLVVCEMLQEILTAPRESLIRLSKDNVQQIKNNLQKLMAIFSEIQSFGLQNSSESQNLNEEHKSISQNIVRLSHDIKRELGPTISYLNSKKAEQLETQVMAALDDTVNDTVEKLNTETDRLQEQSNQAEQNEEKRQEDFNQLREQWEDLLAEGSVSRHEKIFSEQADKHQRLARRWLISTVVLVVGFGLIFYWFFNALKLGGTAWVGVLQNIFTKGFLLSLIYLVLNRSIKSYTAEKHLEVVNRHRQNALRTFNAFHSAAGENQETQDAVLIAATSAIFDANQSGYLSTRIQSGYLSTRIRGSESVSPIQQVVRAVTPSSSSTRSEQGG